MKKFFLFSVLFSISACILSAQEQKPAIQVSHELIESGIEAYDKEQFREALEIFDQVRPCDPNYAWALYESALCYRQLDQADSAKALCYESYLLNPEDPVVAVLYGSILDETGNAKEAVEFLEALEKKWPFNANLLYNLGISYINNNQIPEAESVMLRELRIRPFHATGHIALAKINHIMGRTAQSYLAYNMAILLNPRTSFITAFESLITGKEDSLSRPYDFPYQKGTDHRHWDELGLLLRSGLAFNEKYEFPGPLNFVTTRQSYLLFSRMKFNEQDPSYYNQYYVRFFNELHQNKFFDTYQYYSFKDLNNQKASAWINQNTSQINQFVEWAQQRIIQLRDYDYSLANEQNEIQSLHYNDDNILQAIGTLKGKAEPVMEGEWLLLAPNGMIREKGWYHNDRRQGDWYIYETAGVLSQHLIYNADEELDGVCKTFHPNGQPNGIYPRKKGKQEGTEREFTKNGSPLSSADYKDGNIHGNSVYFNYDKGFSRMIPYVNGKAEGPFIEKWLNGKLKCEGSYRDSLLTGPMKTYFTNGQLESEITYKNDTAFGKQSHYAEDGRLVSESETDAQGRLTGSKRTYYRSGKLKELEDHYQDGLLTGQRKAYFEDGKIACIQTMRKDTLVKVESFNAAGTMLYRDSTRNNRITYRSFFPNGVLEMECTYIDNLLEGPLYTYYPNGNAKNRLSYSGGLLSGTQFSYHLNGALNEEILYDSGFMNGPYKSYYESGALRQAGFFMKDKEDGEWVTYFPNGQKSQISFYDQGTNTGRTFSYNLQGKLEHIEQLDADGNSERITLFKNDGSVEGEMDYRNDSLRFVQYHKSGMKRRVWSFKDQELHGVQQWYYPNGQLRNELQLIYGKVDGRSAEYDHHGLLRMDMNYYLGEIHGIIKGYENGVPDFVQDTWNGMTHGEYREFYPNGKTYRVLNFDSDVKQGYASYYSPDSLLMFRAKYNQGVLVELSYLDRMKQMLPPLQVTNETKEIVAYYPTGARSAVIQLKNGLNHGKTIYYYPNGQVSMEIQYEAGVYNGLFQSYYSNGKLKKSTLFTSGLMEGHHTSYYANGNKQMEGDYLMNQEDGKWQYYDATGKPTELLVYENGEIIAITK